MAVMRVMADGISVPAPSWDQFPSGIKHALEALGGNLTALVLLGAGLAVASGLLMTLVGAGAGNIVLTSRGRSTILIGVLAGGGLYALVEVAQAVLRLLGG